MGAVLSIFLQANKKYFKTLRLILMFFVGIFLFSSCSQKVYVVHYPKVPVPSEMPVVEELPKVHAPIPEIQSSKPLIVIDAGHGGKDFGTEAKSKPTFIEKNLNLTTAKILERYLRQMGYRTLMTRTSDMFIPLDRRALIANQSGCKFFVSVHYNSAPSTQADGIEIFYYRSETANERSQASKRLAETVLRSLIRATDAKSRGVKHGDLAVLRKTDMPAILVEGGFLTNEEELLKLRDPAYIKTIAWGIAQGIQAYSQ